MKACSGDCYDVTAASYISHLHSIGGVTESISELDIELHILPSDDSAPPSTELSDTLLYFTQSILLPSHEFYAAMRIKTH